MGVLLSVQEELEKETPQKSTPVRRANQRLLSLDPRSPSEGINRTPIIVEKTPVPASHLVRNHHPVASGGTIGDPRSPSIDFSRTPINPCLAADGQSTRNGPSVLGNSTSTATMGSESGIESAEVTPVRDLCLGPSMESPDSAFSAGEVQSDEPVGVISETESASPPSLADDINGMPLSSATGLNAEDTPKLPVLRTRPQALNKLSRLAVEAAKLCDSPPVTRSPLSNVGNARIVLGLQQNKVMPAVGDQLPYRSAADAGVDKENCFR